MKFDDLYELEDMIDYSEDQLDLESNMVMGLSLAAIQGKEILCYGESDESGEIMFGVEEVHENVFCGCIFTSLEYAEESGMDFVKVDLAGYLHAMVQNTKVDGMIINRGTQNAVIARQEMELIIEVLEMTATKDDSPKIRGFVNLMDGFEWIPDKACVFADKDLEFSDTAKNTIEHVHYYMDGNNCFALLSDSVVYIADYNPKDGQDIYLAQLQEDVEDAMDEANSYHPDFSKYTMDDGMLAVKLFNGIWCFKDPSGFKDPYDDFGEPSLETALWMRQEILDACAKANVMAYVVNDMEKKE